MNRAWIFLLMAAMLFVLGSCSKNAEPEGTLFVSGRIDGDTMDISPKFAGKIEEITVREGDPVEASQMVARISSPQDEAQVLLMKADLVSVERKLEEAQAAAPARVAVAEANLAAAKAELVRSEAQLQQCQLDAKRYPPLVLTGAAAAQTADQHETNLRVAVASADASRKQVVAEEAAVEQAKAQLQQIATAKANVAAGRAALQKQEATMRDLTITVPIAGTILTRSAEPGRVVQAGQTILTMVDMHKLYLRGFITEGLIGKIKVGQGAQVYLDSNPKQAIPAVVIRIDPQAMFTPENTYFKEDRVKQVVGVKLGLQGAYGFAKPGMPADGRIQIGTQ
jgi:HlyD family secretion protein